ncbi:MAG: hypothetical protein AAF725_05190 [Acidobacteriota bacterium]
MTLEATASNLMPTQDALRELTDKALGDRVDRKELDRFYDLVGSGSGAEVLGATASLKIFVWGVLHCEPYDKPYSFDAEVWGAGASAVESVGFMYTAYTEWGPFFRDTTAFHVQGAAVEGGVLQINWFRKDGLPIGQYNGVAGGIGAFEAGGAGTWNRR